MESARGDYDRTPLVAAAIVVAVGIVAVVDFRDVVADVPEAPAVCDPPSAACESERTRQFEARLDRALELEDDYRGRAWLYGAGALAAVLIAAAVAYRQTAPTVRRELFTDLGVGAVVWLLAWFSLALAASGDLVDAPAEPFTLPGFAVLAVAAVGTLLTRRAPAVEGMPGGGSAEPRGRTAVRLLGFGFTAAAVVAAAIAFGEVGDPCIEDVSGSVETLLTIAWVAAAAAAICGLISLAQRRWMGSLVMLTVGPFAALVASFTTVCWN